MAEMSQRVGSYILHYRSEVQHCELESSGCCKRNEVAKEAKDTGHTQKGSTAR